MQFLNGLVPPHLRALVLMTALALVLLEYGVGRLARHDVYDWRESAASVGVAVAHSLLRGVEALVMAVPIAFVYRHRLFDFPQTDPVTLAALFVAVEFTYYWFHRASHRVRWLWATHAVHHSATHLNLTAAIRLGWTGNLSGNFLFFLPLVWIGFHPVAVFAMLGVNLLYQFFVHTELAPGLGPLEWVLNTPRHHQVHHAANAACLDRNYGGILIVFDRLFGTFAVAPAMETLRYGLVGGTPSYNPLRIALGEWAAMLRDAWRARGGRARLAALFGPPGG